MSGDEGQKEHNVVQRRKTDSSVAKTQSKPTTRSALFLSLQKTLTFAPDSLLEFLESRKEEERKGLVNNLRYLSERDTLEYEHRRKWIISKYPHAFSEEGLTEIEKNDIRSQLSIHEPICGPGCKMNVLMLLVAFMVISLVLYNSAQVNTFEYLHSFFEKSFKPTFPDQH